MGLVIPLRKERKGDFNMQTKRENPLRIFMAKHRKRVVAGLSVLSLLVVIGVVLAAPPNVTGVNPGEGTSLGGQTVIIEGSGFTNYTIAPGINFAYTGGCVPYDIPSDGFYRLETWGAQGGNAGPNAGGRGGYSVGTVYLTAGTRVYVCVGGQGLQATRTQTSAFPGGFNGGGGAYRTDNGNGHETASGGGGTDIRISVNSLFARAIVAGGGGGAAGTDWGMVSGGAGGGVSGIVSTGGSPAYFGGVGTAVSAGSNNSDGCVGSGVFGGTTNNCSLLFSNASGGGGGWFGGGSGRGGGGGSGFVFTSSSNTSSAVIGGTFLLSEERQLFDTDMISGVSSMPAPGGGNQTGQSGNGFARITKLPYNAKIGGNNCREIEILSDTEIRCVTAPHSAAIVDVEVTIGSETHVLVGGYTYTDKLAIAGPTEMGGNTSSNYTITLDYNYSGTITLSDGGVGGTFSGPAVTGGNQIVFSNQRYRQFTYTPPEGWQGSVTILADSGVSYVENAEIVVAVNLTASSFVMECFDDVYGDGWTRDPFVVPGEDLDCRIILNGSYSGTISLADLTGEDDVTTLGGVFSSVDPRFSGGTFTTTTLDTSDFLGQVLEFTYTSPDWATLLGMYDGTNGYLIFWPVFVANTSPVLTSPQGSVSAGLLAQSYSIISYDMPPIDSPGAFGCVGCPSRFRVSTFNAPYFGSITISSEVMVGGVAQSGGTLFIGGSEEDTITLNFNGSGGEMVFRYTPNVVGDNISGGVGGDHTIFGTSSSPAIADDDIAFEVISSRIYLTCTPTEIARGGTSECTLIYNHVESDNPFVEINLSDLFIINAPGAPPSPGGIFTDTSSVGGTFVGNTFTFCGGVAISDPTLPCPDAGETYVRTFTYTLPVGADEKYSRLRIDAVNPATSDANRAILDIIPDTVLFYCSADYPNCETAHVGELQDYVLKPNGVFTGRIVLTDEDPGNPYHIPGNFSDRGEASWVFSADEFVFAYTPASTGIKTLRATVVEVDDPNSGIKVGDTFTMTVYVAANEIAVEGPDLVARDEVPTSPRFSVILNGPFSGVIEGRLVRRSGVIEIPFTGSTLVGTPNFTDNGDGTFSCVVTIDMYDAATNTTTACMADSGSAAGFIADYNWFDIVVGMSGTTAEGVKTVGLVADGYSVSHGGVDATLAPIIATVGTPIDFTVTPNALFAGEYSFGDGGFGGSFVPLGGSITVSQSGWPATNNQNMQSRTFTYVPLEPGVVTLVVNATREAGITPTGGNASLGEKTITVIVMANRLTIEGPASVTIGQTANYALVLNGPFVGEISLDEWSDESGASGVFSTTHCVFTLADYDEVTNTTRCVVQYTATGEHYFNTATFFASSDTAPPLTAVRLVDLLASDFSVAATGGVLPSQVTSTANGMEIDYVEVGNVITFTVTPNAQFEGNITIAPTANINNSTLTWTYAEYATVGQDPISRTFTFTATAPGLTTLTLSGPGGEKVIDIFIVGDALDIVGPSRIQKGTSEEFTVRINGYYDGVVAISLYSPDGVSDISSVALSQSSCTFVAADYDPVTRSTWCTFTVDVPAGFGTHWVGISAAASVLYDERVVAVTANDFVLTPGPETTGTVGVPITFTLTTNGLFEGTISLSDGGAGGTFSMGGVEFNSMNWPAVPLQELPEELTFTYTPAIAGSITITASDANVGVRGLGSRLSVIVSAPCPNLIGVPDTGMFGGFEQSFAIVAGFIGAVVVVAGGVVGFVVIKRRRVF